MVLHPAQEKVRECRGDGERGVPLGESRGRATVTCAGVRRVHLAILGEKCLLRTSIMKAAGGWL